MTPKSAVAEQTPTAGTSAVEAQTGPRFSVRLAANGTYEIDDARGLLQVVQQGANARDIEAARHYAARFNRMSDIELEQLAAVTGTDVASIDVDADGVPTVIGYRQLYRAALDHLTEAEPVWSRKSRDHVARQITEAYCHGAVAARSHRNAVAREGCR
jgi:hypothetical protein